MNFSGRLLSWWQNTRGGVSQKKYLFRGIIKGSLINLERTLKPTAKKTEGALNNITNKGTPKGERF